MRTLRPYQTDAITAVREAFKTQQSTLLVLPTGMGKTVVMAKLASEWDKGNVLLLAHRIELLEQARDKIAAELGYAPPIEQAERGADPNLLWQGGCVVVGSVQSMCSVKRMEKFRQCPFDLILVDEAHHATAASYRRIVDFFLGINPNCKVLGVTATPRRADNTALGIVFGHVAYQMPIVQSIEEGWLVPIVQESVCVEGVDFAGLRSSKNDFGESDFNASDLEAILIEEEPLHAMARPILDKSVYFVEEDGKQIEKRRQTLIFTAGVAHAHLLAGVLNREREGCAAAIDGETPKERRRDVVAQFCRGEIQYLTNFGVFTEGFDAPPVSLVVMGRPTKSLSLYTQMLGRGMRPLDGVADGWNCNEDRRLAILTSEKREVLVLDFVGNSQHKLVSSVDVLGGNYDVDVVQEVKERVQGKQGPLMEEMRKAKAEILLEREQKARREIRARVEYSTAAVDPFAPGDSPTHQDMVNTRGGASDAQIGFLVNLGVSYATASAYTRKQAGAVITSLKETRCTAKQRAILQKYGENPDVNFDTASAIIDEISKAGWQRRK